MNPMWPVVMTDLGGYRVCAKRGGKPFKDAVRVDKRGKCKDPSFVRCHKKSIKKSNAICVQKGTKCPVTGIKFADSLAKLHELLSKRKSPYKIEDVRGYNFPKGLTAVKGGTWKLKGKTVNMSFLNKWGFIVQSRSENNLPITTIKLSENEPCLDPTEENIQKKFELFDMDLRHKYKKTCSKIDERYKPTGLKISEATLHSKSKVKDQI